MPFRLVSVVMLVLSYHSFLIFFIEINFWLNHTSVVCKMTSITIYCSDRAPSARPVVFLATYLKVDAEVSPCF